MSTPLRALWLAWGAVVALLAYPAASQAIGQQSGIMGGDSGFLRPVGGGGASLTIDTMPYARTVTCGSYTLTGSASGAGAVSWSASPSGASGSCTGTTSWSCVVSVAPDATGEGVETITVSQAGGASDTETIGFYVNGAHSCFLSQSVDGSYNSTLADLDAVATWENLGSSALDVTQGTGAAQPTFRTGIVGGQPVVRCDGGDRVAAATASDWTFMSNGNDLTVDYVASPSSTNDLHTYVATTDTTLSITDRGFASTIDDRAAVPAVDRLRWGVSNGTALALSFTSSNSVVQVGKFSLHQINVDVTAGNDGFTYVDGTALAEIATGSSFSPSAPDAPLNLCAESDGGRPFTGDFFRVLIYQSTLSATQRGINKAVDEWALGGSFPVTP